LLPTVTVTLNDSNCVNRKASLKRFSSISFTTNKLVDRLRNVKSNAPQNDQEEKFCGKHTLQARFIQEKNVPLARFLMKKDLSQQNAPQAGFLDSALMGTLSY